MIDDRIENFARCGVSSVDEWANQFRLDRRMPIARALALLSVAPETWKPLPKQGYVSTILDFFAKRISGGVLRGPLTRMLIGKTARVDLTELDTSRVPAAEILEHLLSRGTRTVNIDPAAFSENDGLERRLRSLHSHALLYRRDTGIDGLYMAFPFLLMRDGRPNAKPRIAPVLLWPARVIPEVGNRGHVTLGYGRERSTDAEAEYVVVNPALEGMVGIQEAKRWQEAAQELLARATFSALDVMDAFGHLATAVGNTLSPLPGKDVKVGAQERQILPSAVLFHLAFMGQAVMKDLELLRGLPPNATALEAALRLSDHKPESDGPVSAREIERFFTADSDPSQEAAVMEARQAPGLVVEGPPGTGKSQTIVNMVADAIGMGKSLLVICQKQAALEVVRKRLDKERLGNRFVMITDVNSDRGAIIASVREQVERLHSQPVGGAPAWKRDRERLAARIELLEADLDRQQTALHAVDPNTGLTYRTLLGELLAIEAAQPKPIDLPSIRPLLTDLHPADVVTLEENCGPLARFWLPAKFEGSALSVLKLFNPDRGTADTLVESLRTFAEIDARREEVDAETSNSLDVADAERLRTWMAGAGNLRSIGDALCTNLGRWLPLFRSPEGNGSRGTNMLAGLIQVEAGLSALNASHHQPGISEKLISSRSDELRKLGALAKAVLSPVGGLGHINPMRWIRKRNLRKLMTAMELVPDDEGVQAFDNAIDLEMGLRPLRLKLADYVMALFNRAPDSKLPPAPLAALAGNLHSIVTRVHGFVSLIDECPQKAELDQAAMTGAMKDLDTFFDRADRSLQRHDARAASSQALEQLKPYLDELWIGLRRSAIHGGRSNGTAISLILEAAPTLASFQEFRLRSVRLGEVERTIFRTLRAKETELLRLPAADLDACVRGTIAREARIAWKAAMEASNPEVLFDGDASDVKVKSLAEADRQIRNCNRELLINGIDPGRIRPTRDWEQ